jgi:uncharacterized protein YjbI with pentapeptide repeats
MANPEHLEILKQGAKVWNKWRLAAREIRPDFSDAFFSKADLSYTNLSYADLRGAFLRGAFLSSTFFRGADLSNANLSYADLRDAYLRDADLRGADLRDANLSEADLSYADLNSTKLSGAKFNDAQVGYSTFDNSDLSAVIGLETVKHYGPSEVGINTIYLSQGKIPEKFLLGCGIPEAFITHIPALVGAAEPIQFYSCFISYSTKDEEFARRLYSRMRDEHLRVWFAPEDIKGGQKLHEQIERAIQLHDRLLIVLSENSMQSEWVITEIQRARKTEMEENRRKLFPITIVDFDRVKTWKCFDADSGKDLAKEVREYFIPDFSNWKDHDDFEKAFDRLLRDLKAEEKMPDS